MFPSRACAALLMTVALHAAAQSAPAPIGSLRADLSFAPVAHRNGEAIQLEYPIRYSGLAPSYGPLAVTWYPGGFFLGAAADFQLDTFVVRGAGFTASGVEERVVGTAFTAAASGRFALNPSLSIEAQAGLALGQVPFPLYDSSVGDVGDNALTYMGPVVSLGGEYALSGYTVEARVRAVPFALGASINDHSATAQQLSVRLQAVFNSLSFSAATFELLPLASYELTSVSGKYANDATPDITASQVSHRISIGLRAAFGAAMRKRIPTGPGIIRGQVLADSGEPLPGATVTLTGAKDRYVVADPKGMFVLKDVPPGPAVLEVEVAGYRVARQEVTMAPETELTSSLTVVKKTGPGRIVGKTFALNEDGSRGAPLPGVQVEGPGAQFVVSDATGAFTLKDVGPGLITVFIRGSGYTEAEEVVNVPPETDAELEVTLAKQKQKTLASLRGLVRSVGGQPIAAALKIPEAKVATRAGADGRFVVRLPGGRYTVVFSAPGYVTQSKVIVVADGDQALFYVDLSPEER